MTGLNVTWMIATALVAYEALAKQGELPAPQKFIWIVAIWSILGLVAAIGAPQIAVVFGAGLVIAMLYQYVLNGKLYKPFGDGKPATTGKTGTTGSREGPSSLPQPKAS